MVHNRAELMYANPSLRPIKPFLVCFGPAKNDDHPGRLSLPYVFFYVKRILEERKLSVCPHACSLQLFFRSELNLDNWFLKQF